MSRHSRYAWPPLAHRSNVGRPVSRAAISSFTDRGAESVMVVRPPVMAWMTRRPQREHVTGRAGSVTRCVVMGWPRLRRTQEAKSHAPAPLYIGGGPDA